MSSLSRLLVASLCATALLALVVAVSALPRPGTESPALHAYAAPALPALGIEPGSAPATLRDSLPEELPPTF